MIEFPLSGIGHVSRLRQWKEWGYRIEIIYLTLPSSKIVLRRIASRVEQGGHGNPKADVRRRFERSWKNCRELYMPIADGWMVYDNSGGKPILIEEGP